MAFIIITKDDCFAGADGQIGVENAGTRCPRDIDTVLEASRVYSFTVRPLCP